MVDQVDKRDFPHLPPELDTLLSQLEKFNRPEDVPIRVSLIEHSLTLVSFANHPDRWALLQFLLQRSSERLSL